MHVCNWPMGLRLSQLELTRNPELGVIGDNAQPQLRFAATTQVRFASDDEQMLNRKAEAS